MKYFANNSDSFNPFSDTLADIPFKTAEVQPQTSASTTVYS